MVDDDIRELLDKISAQMRRNYGELLRELDLHVGQDNFLCALWTSDGLTQVQLCEHLRCEAPTVTNMVKCLEKKGIVYRQSDESDGRVSRIFLTGKGQELREPILDRWRQQQAKLLEGIPHEERLLLRKLMKQMENNLL